MKKLDDALANEKEREINKKKALIAQAGKLMDEMVLNLILMTMIFEQMDSSTIFIN